jgi:hypothetical protein
MYLVALGFGIATYVVALQLLQPEGDLTAFPKAMLVGRIVFSAVTYLLILHLQHRDAVREARP